MEEYTGIYCPDHPCTPIQLVYDEEGDLWMHCPHCEDYTALPCGIKGNALDELLKHKPGS